MNRFLSIKKIKPVIDRVFDFKDAQQAFAYLESQKHVGKIVVRVVNNRRAVIVCHGCLLSIVTFIT